MATLYLKAAGGNWSAAATWSSTGSGGVDSAGPPTATTNVILEAGSGNLTIDATAACRSIDTTSGTGTYIGTITHSSGIGLAIGDATAGAGNVALKFNATMGYTRGNNASSITFLSTSTTQQTINFAGQQTANVTFSGVGSNYAVTGTWNQLSTSTVTHSNGTLHMDGVSDNSGLSHSLGFLVTASGATRTLNLGTATIALTGTGSVFNTSPVSGLTLVGSSSTINCTGSSATFAAYGGASYGTVTMTGASATIIGGGSSFVNFSRTGTAVKTDSLTISTQGFTVTGTLTLAGNSSTNRLLVKSWVIGSQMTITNTGATMTWSNVDFKDVKLSSTFNASAITGLSGDCGGNTNITFTTSATQTWQGTTGGSWSTSAKWTSRVPLPQDDVVINNAFSASQTVTLDMPRLGRSIDFTGLSGSPTISANTIAMEMYGSLTLVSGMTFTTGSTGTWSFAGRGSYTITSAGKSFASANTMNNTNGTYTLNDTYTQTSGTLSVSNGTLTTGGFTLSLVSLTMAAGTNGTTLNLGASTVTLSGTGTVWTGTTTINAGTSTIQITNASSTGKTFATGGLTYNNIQVTTGGTGILDFTGSGTLANLSFSGGSTQFVRFASGTTTTFTGGTSAIGSGASGNLISIISPSVASVVPVLTKSGGGTVQSNYLSIQGLNVTPSNTWYYGNNSVAGTALMFAGQASSGDNVSVSNSATVNQLSGATSFSWELWLANRSASGTNPQRFVDKAAATTAGYVLYTTQSSSKLAIDIFEGGTAKTTNASASMSLNSINHIVYTWTSGSAPKIYLNGSEVAYTTTTSVTTPGNDSANSMYIGNLAAANRTFDGVIYSYRIYRNKALSSSEVTTAYNAGNKSSQPVTGATAEYLFNDGSGSTLTESINSTNGTITGALWANLQWNSGSVALGGGTFMMMGIG
jgi:hypothetical protein